ARESLGKIEIGDDRDTLMVKRSHSADTDQPHGDPWKGKHVTGLGHVLNRENVADDNTPLEELDLLHWGDSVFVVLAGNRVRAVIIHDAHGGETGRGVRVGDTESVMKQRYPEEPALGKFSIKTNERAFPLAPPVGGLAFASSKPPVGGPNAPQWGETFRYDELGIGFEIVGDKITAITLYPPKGP